MILSQLKRRFYVLSDIFFYFEAIRDKLLCKLETFMGQLTLGLPCRHYRGFAVLTIFG
jgi:hypothetical protein